MARKSRRPTFDESIEPLRSHSFAVETYKGAGGGTFVSKHVEGHGVGAVLVPGAGKAAPPAFAVPPGILVRGEIARLVDRGYQKFIKSSQYELPATATQLHAIHAFSEELRQLTGEISLYNEALGTVSDLYLYDRLQGREQPQPEPPQPWELANGH
ncbi:MAG: hypothetical protein ACRD3N_18445 [Terracidiphilus sp.]